MSRISSLTAASPPTSSQVTFGIDGAPMLLENEARTPPTALSKSAPVRRTLASRSSDLGELPPDLNVAMSQST